MNVQLLIDAIVRQTMVLIAELATSGGLRAPLAHVAGQAFLGLARELESQGVSKKVSADMFGMALRTYHDRVARMAESQSETGRSLWDAVLAYLQESGPVLRVDVLRRFSRDNEAMVRGVLRDLVQSGLAFQSGQGDRTTYRAATAEEQGMAGGENRDGAIANMVLVAIHRHGPCTRDEIQKLVPLADDALDGVLAHLKTDGRVVARRQGGSTHYQCERVFIPYGDPDGWEAAVLDHYQAVVMAICAKLRTGRTQAIPGEWIGGSTYHFDIWDGHPFEQEALGFLSTMRRQAVLLREAIERHNASHARAPEAGEKRIVSYVGQTVVMEEATDDE